MALQQSFGNGMRRFCVACGLSNGVRQFAALSEGGPAAAMTVRKSAGKVRLGDFRRCRNRRLPANAMGEPRATDHMD
ncbi:MAG: hypothetical protein CML23_04305 [Rhizobiaceae bacterium]|nr:hypothetical protein [Rhizobiaceae bacterium]